MARKRLPDSLMWSSGVVVTIFAAIYTCACFTERHCSTKPRHSEMKKVGMRVVQALEAYRESHGAYPATLELAGINASCGDNCALQYEVMHGGMKYRMYLGDIIDDGFSLVYDSESGWYFDS